MTSFSESSEGRRRLAAITTPSVAQLALLGTLPSATAVEPAVAWFPAGGNPLTVIEAIWLRQAFAAR